MTVSKPAVLPGRGLRISILCCEHWMPVHSSGRASQQASSKETEKEKGGGFGVGTWLVPSKAVKEKSFKEAVTFLFLLLSPVLSEGKCSC